MPAVAALPAKPRRRKPVAKSPSLALAAAPATAESNGAPDTKVTSEIPPIKELKALLDKLDALYLEPNLARLPEELRKLATWGARVAKEHNIKDGLKGPRLPSAEELSELVSCIEKVAQQINIKKISIPYLHGVIRHIYRRYPKTGVENFVAKLVKRITSLPIPISTRIKQALADCGSGDTARVQALKRIQELLKGRDWEPAPKDEQWRSLYPVLLEFTSPQFKQLLQKSKPSTMQPIDVRSCELAFQGVLGFAAFHDLQRQHLVWLLDYEPKMVPVAKFIYAFQNEEWDRELRMLLHGSAVTPSETKRQMKTVLASARKKRWRKADKSTSENVDKKPIQDSPPYKKRGHRG
jgi:hypothetical protein